jgi:hypothetical protein
MSAKAELFVSSGLTSALCDLGHNFLKFFRYALAHLGFLQEWEGRRMMSIPKRRVKHPKNRR